MAPAAASATQIYVSADSLSNGYDMVTFAPVDPSQPQWSGGTDNTGQQMLTANPGTTYNGSQLFNTYAWCVDVFDNIYLGGDSIVYNLQPLNVPNAGEIAKVAMWGDEQLAKGPNELISAAVQAEIWELEYNVTVSAATDPWDNDVTSELETEVTAINDMFSDPLSPALDPTICWRAILSAAGGLSPCSRQCPNPPVWACFASAFLPCSASGALAALADIGAVSG